MQLRSLSLITSLRIVVCYLNQLSTRFIIRAYLSLLVAYVNEYVAQIFLKHYCCVPYSLVAKSFFNLYCYICFNCYSILFLWGNMPTGKRITGFELRFNGWTAYFV